MKIFATFITTAALVTLGAGCGQSPGGGNGGGGASGDGTHTHADGTVHSDDAHRPGPPAPSPAPAASGHGHDEVSLGTAKLGDIEVALEQGHGAVEAGKEGHLVVKLPYSDTGATVVRAWIGTDDRTLSSVGKGTYNAASDGYDIHATAPDPLPANVRWWIEIEKPDGTTIVGSAKPLL